VLKVPEPDLWTGDQLNHVAAQLLMLVAFFFGRLVFKSGSMSLLWEHPLGVRMLIGCAVLTVFNFGLYLLLHAMLNRCFPPNSDEVKRRRATLSSLLLAIHLIVFFAPVFLILLLGPASIQFAESLVGI